jgi:hypothetical protein
LERRRKMLRTGRNITKSISRSEKFKENDIVSPVFYNVGGTAFSVNGIPVSEKVQVIGFVNDQMILKYDDFDIRFTDNSNKQNLIIVAYSQYDELVEDTRIERGSFCD